MPQESRSSALVGREKRARVIDGTKPTSVLVGVQRALLATTLDKVAPPQVGHVVTDYGQVAKIVIAVVEHVVFCVFLSCTFSHTPQASLLTRISLLSSSRRVPGHSSFATTEWICGQRSEIQVDTCRVVRVNVGEHRRSCLYDWKHRL